MSDDTNDDMRLLIVGILDKLNQLEALYSPLLHTTEAQTAIAEIHAYRVTARGFLARLRALATEGGGGTDGHPPGDTTGVGAGAAGAGSTPANLEKSDYRDARR